MTRGKGEGKRQDEPQCTVRGLLHATKVRPRQQGIKLVVVHPSHITPSIGISSQRLHIAFAPDNLVKCLHMSDLFLGPDDTF